jgi:hypothetical protein
VSNTNSDHPATSLASASTTREFPLHQAGPDGWSEWVCPDPNSYLMKCCDCGLVHELQFRVAKYEPRPSDQHEVVPDENLQAQFRARREIPYHEWAALPREQRGGPEQPEDNP